VQKVVLGRRKLAALALSLSGCSSSSFLPEDGPQRGTVIDGASIKVGNLGNQETVFYALIRVNPNVLSQISAVDAPGAFSSDLVSPGSGGNNSGVGVGDFINVTIFESGAGGLFIPSEPGTRSGNYVTLPPQQVDAAGKITVPYAGSVKVLGMSPQAIGRMLESRLSGRALEPQVLVSVPDRRANSVTVTGDVNSSTHFVMDPGGERLLGALARAGGPKYPPYESFVQLQRGNISEKVMLADIMRDPQQNIPLLPGDTIYVTRQQRYYLALGALGPGQFLGLVNRRLPFEDSHLSIADAIAKVGGISDDRANARAVFVYRFEPRDVLAKVGALGPADLPDRIATVYYLDMAEGGGYFLASKFPVRDEDLIYVSNSPSTDLTKFLALILPAAYTAANFKTL
jgi:polysaccharide export outer membrane protein